MRARCSSSVPLGGYSAIWLARTLPPGGRLVTIELDPACADIARQNFRRAGCADAVDLRVGPALEILPHIEAEGLGPFDFIFIDADKVSYPQYLAWSIKLARTGSLIVADNVVRNGAVADAASDDAAVQAVRRFYAVLAAETTCHRHSHADCRGEGSRRLCGDIGDRMTPVFITGGSGYIGRPLIEELLKRKFVVHALARTESAAKLPPGASVVIGNALDAATFTGAIPAGSTFVHLIGTPHPNPAKAAEFQRVDLASVKAAVTAAAQAGVQHFVYVSVAHPAPVMRAYIAVREEGETLVRASRIRATILRPWYIIGPPLVALHAGADLRDSSLDARDA